MNRPCNCASKASRFARTRILIHDHHLLEESIDRRPQLRQPPQCVRVFALRQAVLLPLQERIASNSGPQRILQGFDIHILALQLARLAQDVAMRLLAARGWLPQADQERAQRVHRASKSSGEAGLVANTASNISVVNAGADPGIGWRALPGSRRATLRTEAALKYATAASCRRGLTVAGIPTLGGFRRAGIFSFDPCSRRKRLDATHAGPGSTLERLSCRPSSEGRGSRFAFVLITGRRQRMTC